MRTDFEYGALLEMSMHLQELCRDPMLNNISETSLTLVQIRAVNIIAHFDPDGMSVKQLAGILKLSSGATSKLVDRIVRDGIVARTPSETDRRSVILRITPLAHSLAEYSVGKARTMLKLIMKDFTEAERMAYLEFNRKFCERIWNILKQRGGEE